MMRRTGRRILVRGLVTLVSMAASWPLLAGESETTEPLLKLLVEQGVITAEQAAQVSQEQEQVSPAGTQPTLELPKALKGLSIGTLAYASYQDSDDESRFTLKRGYINIEKEISSNFGARVTPDVHLDENGDFKVRLKYLYGKFKWSGNELITKPYVEFGLVHIPWLDFEEHINRYRMQDTMFMERNGLFNSADLGFTFGANLGPELGEEYTKTVNNHYAGRYGSFQVGMYNGGGYHAAEKNDNKVVEARLTVRPAPDVLPGLQLSAFGVSGKGNTAGTTPPQWQVLSFMVSYESQYFVATGQVYDGKGNQKGSVVDATGEALDQDGYSVFAEVRLPANPKLSFIGRFDSFDTSSDDPFSDTRERTIAGVAWQFHQGNYWLLDYDRVEHSIPGQSVDDRLQLTLQIKY